MSSMAVVVGFVSQPVMKGRFTIPVVVARPQADRILGEIKAHGKRPVQRKLTTMPTFEQSLIFISLPVSQYPDSMAQCLP